MPLFFNGAIIEDAFKFDGETIETVFFDGIEVFKIREYKLRAGDDGDSRIGYVLNNAGTLTPNSINGQDVVSLYTSGSSLVITLPTGDWTTLIITGEFSTGHATKTYLSADATVSTSLFKSWTFSTSDLLVDGELYQMDWT